MIFLEFFSPNYPFNGAKHYFVGTSQDAILADTKGGTEFGFGSFSSSRAVTGEDVRSLNFNMFDKGVKAVAEGCKSYYLGYR